MLPYLKYKAELRRAAKSAVRNITPEQKKERSALIFKNILKLDVIKSAKVVALYASLADEVDTTTAIDALHNSKTVVLPRVEGDSMSFYRYDPERISIGAFGILEPQTLEAIDPSEIDVMIIPGVAFTKDGKRCGRGKGYYDKYLSDSRFRATKIGVCYAEQIAEDIETEPHDEVVDMVFFAIE